MLDDPRTLRRTELLLNTVAVVLILWYAWSWYNYSGLYRLLAEAQLRMFGSYGEITTGIVGASALGFALLVLGARVTKRRLALAPAAPRPTPVDVAAQTRRLTLRMLIGMAAVGLAVAGVEGGRAWYHARHVPVVATVDADVSPEVPAGADQVVLSGHSGAPLIVEVRTSTSGSSTTGETALYMAVIGRSWAPGRPVPFVVKATSLPSELVAGGVSGELRRVALGVAEVGGRVPGLARAELERRGAPVGGGTVVLNEDLDAGQTDAIVWGAVAGFVGVAGLIGWAFERRRTPGAPRAA